MQLVFAQCKRGSGVGLLVSELGYAYVKVTKRCWFKSGMRNPVLAGRMRVAIAFYPTCVKFYNFFNTLFNSRL
jgi:hypothetical protein